LGFYEGTKEVVAVSDHCCSAVHRDPDCHVERFGHCPIYLYTILKEGFMMLRRIEVIETISVLALATLVFHFVWEVKWLIWLATGLLVLTLKPNPLATLIAKLWLMLSEHIGNFMSKVILSLVFFLLLTPIAALYRLFNREMTKSFFDRTSASTFRSARVPGRGEFKNPW
jgi:hypothetical protein